MPIYSGSDTKGKYFQWGNKKKYYYNTENERKIALMKAVRQGIAININKLN